MNIVVEVAPPLVAAVEGRRRLELGIPPSSDMGDLMDTLLTLYPKLLNHVVSDRALPGRTGINVYWLAKRQTLYLCASPSKRLAAGPQG